MAECGLQDYMIFYLILLEIILSINLPQFILLLIRLIEWTSSEEKQLRRLIVCQDCESRSSMRECQTCFSQFKRFSAKLNSVKRRDINEIIAFIHSIEQTELILHLCQKYSNYENTYFCLFEYYVSGTVSLYLDHNLCQYICEIKPRQIRHDSISLGWSPRPLEPYITKAMKKRVVGFFSTLFLPELKHFALNGIRIPERDFVASVYIASFLKKNGWQLPHNGYLAEVLMFTWEINTSEAQYPLYALEQMESALQRVGVRPVFDPEVPSNSF